MARDESDSQAVPNEPWPVPTPEALIRYIPLRPEFNWKHQPFWKPKPEREVLRVMALEHPALLDPLDPRYREVLERRRVTGDCGKVIKHWGWRSG